MHPRQAVPPELLRLATAQAGVLSREQILALGLSRHVLQRFSGSAWTRISTGVYAVGPVSWLSVAWAGVLVGGDRARLGGRAAAYLSGLSDQPPDEMVVWVRGAGDVPRRRCEVAPFGWEFRRDRRGVRGPGSVGTPPRLPIAQTVVDLVGESSTSEAVGWLTTCVQRRLASPAQLRRALSGRTRVPGRALIEQILADVADGAQSPLELRYLRDVERAHDLPRGRRQVRRRNTVADVLYEECALLVELDGRIGHLGDGRFRDLTRDNSATSDGLATLRYGWIDVSGQPCVVASQVSHNLALRGWLGRPRPCGRPTGCVLDLAA